MGNAYTLPDALHNREGSVGALVERKSIERFSSHSRGVLLKCCSNAIVDLLTSYYTSTRGSLNASRRRRSRRTRIVFTLGAGAAPGGSSFPGSGAMYLQPMCKHRTCDRIFLYVAPLAQWEETEAQSCMMRWGQREKWRTEQGSQQRSPAA